MTVIDVPGMGQIRVVRSYEPRDTGNGLRYYHRVSFVREDRSQTVYRVGSAVAVPGSNPFSLYDTVHAALSFYADDDSGEAEEWTSVAEIPFGDAYVVRDSYHVRDDGNGGSDRTRGWQRRKRVRLTRFYGESVGDAAMRSLRTWDPFLDAAPFDSPDSDTKSWERWRTVPRERQATRYGIPCVEFSVRWEGEITRHFDDLVRELKESGASW